MAILLVKVVTLIGGASAFTLCPAYVARRLGENDTPPTLTCQVADRSGSAGIDAARSNPHQWLVVPIPTNGYARNTAFASRSAESSMGGLSLASSGASPESEIDGVFADPRLVA